MDTTSVACGAENPAAVSVKGDFRAGSLPSSTGKRRRIASKGALAICMLFTYKI